MIDLLTKTVSALNLAFHSLESALDPPDYVQRGSYYVYRYTEHSIESAILQKLARLVSGLAATSVLLQHGLYQEVGVMFRVLDELSEDIQFLRLAIVSDETTQLHLDFLKDFFMEEFDVPDVPRESTQKRPTISRDKIQSALSNALDNGINQSNDKEIRRTITKTNGGYVHAASGHILEMVVSDPGCRPRYMLIGMLGTARQAEVEKLAKLYFYDGLACGILAANALDNAEVEQELRNFRATFELVMGITKQEHPERMVRRHKNEERKKSRTTENSG